MSFAPDYVPARVLPSPNCDARRLAVPVDILLFHYTGMETAEAALERLRDQQSRVSCHYFVFEGGEVLQLVPEAQRAWHAGLSFWAGETDINSRSIGIELVNPGHDHGYREFPDRQIAALIALSLDIMGRHGIPRRRVLGHSDVAPMRKRDPGELFPWAELARYGIGSWVEPAPITDGHALGPGDLGSAVLALKSSFAAFGYGVSEGDLYDEATTRVVEAFQRHFRSGKVDGVADRSTLETLRRLSSCSG